MDTDYGILNDFTTDSHELSIPSDIRSTVGSPHITLTHPQEDQVSSMTGWGSPSMATEVVGTNGGQLSFHTVKYEPDWQNKWDDETKQDKQLQFFNKYRDMFESQEAMELAMPVPFLK